MTRAASRVSRARAELASFKRPDGLTVLAELRLTPMFKVDKRALRERR
jgi:non-ribosomal peptide synthetase component E (peptide arylation enzyme)